MSSIGIIYLLTLTQCHAKDKNTAFWLQDLCPDSSSAYRWQRTMDHSTVKIIPYVLHQTQNST
jgi:hypothetical protein